MSWYFSLWLLAQVVATVGLYFSLKLVDVHKVNQFQVYIINYLVALITTLIDIDPNIGFHLDSGKSIFSLWPAFIVGFLFVYTFVLMIASTKRAGIGLTTAFAKMSVVIPVFVGILFLGQVNNLPMKIAGLLLTLISFFVIFAKGNGSSPSKSDSRSKGFILLPLLVFLLNGVSDELQEITRTFLLTTGNDSNIFMALIFVTALVVSILFALADIIKNGFKLSVKAMLIGLLLGICNFFIVKMLLINLNIFGGSIVFPIVNSSVVALTSIMGVVIFKEKLSIRQWIGIGISIVAVVVIAMAI